MVSPTRSQHNHKLRDQERRLLPGRSSGCNFQSHGQRLNPREDRVSFWKSAQRSHSCHRYVLDAAAQQKGTVPGGIPLQNRHDNESGRRQALCRPQAKRLPSPPRPYVRARSCRYPSPNRWQTRAMPAQSDTRSTLLLTSNLLCSRSALCLCHEFEYDHRSVWGDFTRLRLPRTCKRFRSDFWIPAAVRSSPCSKASVETLGCLGKHALRDRSTCH